MIQMEIWTRILTTTTLSKIAIVITAAGSSTRIGSNSKKEYLPYKNGTVLSACANVFFSALNNQYQITHFVITCPKNGIKDCKKALDSYLSFPLEKITIVEGSDTRQKSVFNALKFIAENKSISPDYVLIHDGARPFVTQALILQTINAVKEFGAAVPGLTPVDTQKEMDEDGFVIRHLERKKLCSVQTPQGFEFEKLFLAHQKASLLEKEFTDDTEIYGAFSSRVKIIPGLSENIKITYKKDLELLK